MLDNVLDRKYLAPYAFFNLKILNYSCPDCNYCPKWRHYGVGAVNIVPPLKQKILSAQQ